MPAPGAGGVQTSLVGTVQGMMASARAAFRRKPPPEQRRGAPVQSPGGDKNNPADLSQFAEDFEPSGGLFERAGGRWIRTVGTPQRNNSLWTAPVSIPPVRIPQHKPVPSRHRDLRRGS